MGAFDTYLFVDFSARSTPSPERPSEDAIWIGALRGEASDAHYFRTRARAMEFLCSRLREEVAGLRRVLVGLDFSFGYPAGFARALELHGPPWGAVSTLLSALVEDGPDNRNNRYEVAGRLNARLGDGRGPFWGRPPARFDLQVRPRSPRFPFRCRGGEGLERLRLCERRASGVQEPWKLSGRGAVGSQMLVGIPWLNRLRHAPGLARTGLIWPFETGFSAPRVRSGRPLLLYAESWPGLVRSRVSSQATIRDRAQVLALCRWAKAEDRAGRLDRLFRLPEKLGPRAERLCIAEEGWILGVP